MGIPKNYIEKCYAGWLGKVIGVRHGTLIEGWTYPNITEKIGEITDYLVDYRDYASDDDLNGPLFFLRALEDFECSPNLTAEQIGLTWLNYPPFEHGFYWWGGYGVSTEHTAYTNLRNGIMAPESGSIRTNGATVAEQIGGQIFIDGWGLVSPGNPELASLLAGKAASVSHDGNGKYGGQFVAAAISLAFVEKDIRTVIEKALTYIPQDCEYVRMAHAVMAFYDRHREESWRVGMDYLWENWGYDKYPGNCHIIPNSAVMILSMLWGKGSFSDTLNICNMCGWDTDCNVGNVATIMGVLCGLEDIEPKWTKPVRDFLVASSVVGCLNIMNLPDSVRMICRLGYRLAGEEPPADWADFLAAKETFDFALPRSTCAFRMENQGDGKGDMLFHEDRVYATGHGSLRAVFLRFAKDTCKDVFHKTYYRPADFHDSRYDPAFSPILYPGQSLTARVMPGKDQRLAARLFADGAHCQWLGEEIELHPGEWTELSLALTGCREGRIERAGVRFRALENGWHTVAYLDALSFGGQADYRLDFAQEENEIWTAQHREVTQMTRFRGEWELRNGALHGREGEAYSGNVAWKDVEIRCRLAPGEDGGFLFRTQGAARSYGAFFREGRLSLRKNENGWREVASCAYALPPNGVAEITARCQGSHITLLDEEGKMLIDFDDPQAPYLHGMLGTAAGQEESVFYSFDVREKA